MSSQQSGPYLAAEGETWVLKSDYDSLIKQLELSQKAVEKATTLIRLLVMLYGFPESAKDDLRETYELLRAASNPVKRST